MVIKYLIEEIALRRKAKPVCVVSGWLQLVSTSHVVFLVVRVMCTLGELGEVTGLASAICKKYGCTPRQVYTENLDGFKQGYRMVVDSPFKM